MKKSKKVSSKKVSKAKKVTKVVTPKYLMWLWLGAVAILIGIFAYGYSRKVSQQQAYVQEEVSVEDMTPEEVAINLVSADKKLPMSDDPEVNAMRAADQATRQALEKNKSAEDVERLTEIEARRAARDTLVSLYNVGENAFHEGPLASPNVRVIPSIEQRQKESQSAALKAMDTIKTYFTYVYDAATNKVLLKRNVICEDGSSNGKNCRYVSANFNRVYLNNSGSRLCNAGGEVEAYYPVGTAQVLDTGKAKDPSDDKCRVCTRISTMDGKTKSAGFVNTACMNIPPNMIMTPNSDGNSDNCVIYKVKGLDEYRRKPVRDTENNYEMVLFPDNGQSIIVRSSEDGHPAMELICKDGVMEPK